MDSRGVPSHSSSTIPPTVFNDEIINFDNLCENVTGKLNLKNWMVLPSQRTLHIFSLNKKSNGNLSIQSTIFIDIDLVVKVFGESNDDTLVSLKVFSWPQLQTLIEQCSAFKREVNLEFVDVVDETAKSETNTFEFKDQQRDTLAVDFRGVNTKLEAEVADIHQPLVELVETTAAESEASGHNCSSVSQSYFFHEAPSIYSEYGNQTADNMPDETTESVRQSQICSICNESFLVGDLDRHMQQHFNGESYQCHVCDRDYQSVISLQKHVKSNHTVTGEFLCDICNSGRDFESKASLEKHMEKRHFSAPTAERVISCSFCDEHFHTRKQLTSHMRRHDRSHWRPCPICKKSFSSLNRHIKDMHFNVRNYVCDICGSAYKQWNTLKEHIEIQHSPHKEFFCDICQDGKGYRSKGYIKKHFAKVHIKVGERRQSNRKPFYECNFCNVKLPSRYALKKHVALPHNDGKHPIFPCKTCDKTFTLKSSLTAHERTHIWHICHESGQPINHPNYLKQNLKQNKGVNKRKCTMCEREYVRYFDLKNHMKKMHGVVMSATQQ